MHTAPLLPADALQLAGLWPAERSALLGRLLWHPRTPYARSLVLHMHGAPVGVACAITFHSSAQLTVFRVLPTVKENAAHAFLARAMLAHLDTKGAGTCSLVCAVNEVNRWTELGFVQRTKVLRYDGGQFLQATHDEVVHYEPQHRMGLLHLDRTACGADRSTLLLEHTYLCTVYVEGQLVRGFALPLLGEGLIVADAPAVGLELQRWLFPVQDHVLLPEGNAAHAHLVKQGYRASTVGVLMVRGAVPALKVELVYGWPWGAV